MKALGKLLLETLRCLKHIFIGLKDLGHADKIYCCAKAVYIENSNYLNVFCLDFPLNFKQTMLRMNDLYIKIIQYFQIL